MKAEDCERHVDTKDTKNRADLGANRDFLARPKRLVNFLRGTIDAQVKENSNDRGNKPEKGKRETGSSPPHRYLIFFFLGASLVTG